MNEEQDLYPAKEKEMNNEYEEITIVITKPNGEGYASKSSAHNALRAFKTLNKEVLKVQLWGQRVAENKDDGTFYAHIEPETNEIFPSIIEPKNRVIYRTKADAKNDRPMFDERPKEKTEREIELEKEVAELKQREVANHIAPGNEKFVKQLEEPLKENLDQYAERYVASAPDTSNYYDPFKEIEQLKKERDIAYRTIELLQHVGVASDISEKYEYLLNMINTDIDFAAFKLSYGEETAQDFLDWAYMQGAYVEDLKKIEF